MKIVCSLLFLALCSFAQTLTTGFSAPSASPGNTLNLRLAFNGVPNNVVSLRWQLNSPANTTVSLPVRSDDVATISKIITCASGPNSVCTLATQLPATIVPFTSSLVATIPLLISPSAPLGTEVFTFSNLSAIDTNGNTLPLTVAPITLTIAAPTTTLWFTASAGTNTCRVYKVSGTPVHLTWTCPTGSGTMNGNFTALVPSVSGTALTVGVMNVGDPKGSNSLICLVQVNGTTAPITMVNGSIVAPNSAVYSCTGYATTGNGAISWP